MVLVDLPGFYSARVHRDTRRTQMVSQQIGYHIVGAHRNPLRPGKIIAGEENGSQEVLRYQSGVGQFFGNSSRQGFSLNVNNV
jgi:hypothetical protein